MSMSRCVGPPKVSFYGCRKSGMVAGTAGTHSRSRHSGVSVIDRRGGALIVAISSSACIHHLEFNTRSQYCTVRCVVRLPAATESMLLRFSRTARPLFRGLSDSNSKRFLSSFQQNWIVVLLESGDSSVVLPIVVRGCVL